MSWQNLAHRAQSDRTSIQINYLGGDQLSLPSVSIDGSGVFDTHQRPNLNLHRAATVSTRSDFLKATMNSHDVDVTQTSCCSGGVRRAHSIHICLKTGSCHHHHCKREHLSKKFCQSLFKKLSILSKLRIGSNRTSGAERHSPRSIHWLPKDVSSHLSYNLGEEPAWPTPLSGRAEVSGDAYFPNVATPSPESPMPTFQPAEMDAVANSVFELPDVGARAAAELPDSQTFWPNQVEPQIAGPNDRPMPSAQSSIVSAISSMGQSSGSEYQPSWQMSQCSGVSGFTPATSMSSMDHGHRALGCGHSTRDSPSEPRLRLDTYLAVPQGPITDGPVTDSPTTGDANDFENIREKYESLSDKLTSSNDAIVDETNLEAGFYQAAAVSPRIPLQPQCLDLPEDAESSLSRYFESQPAPDVLADSEPDISLPERILGQDYTEADEDFVERLLDACRERAKFMSEHFHRALATHLEDIFDATMSFHLTEAAESDDLTIMSLRRCWNVSPTIDGALLAMHRLLSGDARPTSYQLVSLAFLAFSLLCHSLNIGDLIPAVRSLHCHAKSWSGKIDHPKEKKFFEDLIDELWLLAGQDSFQTKLFGARQEVPYAFDQSSPQPDSENFIVQVAQIFIQRQ
jgi:hypothetical protein